ncbi:hypothetical protein [Deinococcus roseus]|nr:hypothetical protein [Deinococcus roseus]
MYRLILKIPHYKNAKDIEVLSNNIFLARESRWEVREALALNPRIKPATVQRFVQDTDWTVRQAVSTHPLLTPGLLDSLSQDRYSATTRANVALNPRTPAQVLSRLTRDEDPEVRLGVAKNLGTLPEDLALLMQDTAPQVREYAAAHPFTPLEALQDAKAEPSAHVQRVLMLRLRPLTEAAVQEALKHRRTSVRLVLAGHASTQTDLLDRLLKDRNLLVQSLAALHPGMPAALEGQGEHPRRIADLLMARSDITSANHLTMQGRSGNICFALALAGNPKTPPDTLKQLSHHAHPEVKIRLIQNPSTPAEALIQMVHHPRWRELIQTHPNFSSEVQAQVLELELQEARAWDASPETLHRLAHSRFLEVKLLVAAHRNLQEDTLHFLLQDPAIEVHYTLLEREGLPETILNSMAQESPIEVRRLLALDERSPETALLMLAADTDQTVQMKLLTRPRLPQSVVTKLVQNPHQSITVVQQVLYRPEVNEAVLLALALHADPAVRTWVIADYRLTPAVLEKLADDPHDPIQRQVIQHPLTPAAALLKLTREHKHLWSQLVKNPHTPAEALLVMADDPLYHWCAWPRRNAQFSRKTPSLLVYWMVKRFDQHHSLYRQIGQHPNCNPQVRHLLNRVLD